MRKLLQIALLAGAVAGVFFIYKWLNPPPEKVILVRLEKLAASLSAKPNEGNIARISAINRAAGFFTSDIVVNLEGIPGAPDSISGKTELQQSLMAARARMSGDVAFDGIHIVVDAATKTNATAQFTAVGQLSGASERYAQNVKATFVKVEREWLISRVDAAPRLELEAP